MSRRLLLCLLASGLAAGCASNNVVVKSEYDPTAPFSLYRTFTWVGEPKIDCYGPGIDYALLVWRVRTQVDGDLVAKGYRQDPTNPDLRLEFNLDCRRRTTDSIGQYVTYRDTGGRGGPSEAFVIGYEEGTFVLEMDDSGTGRMVWRGTAALVIEKQFDPARIAAAMKDLLARFPRVGNPMPVPTPE